MLYLVLTLDPEEDHGFKISVSVDEQQGSVPVDPTTWGPGAAELALAIYGNPGSADGLTAIIAALVQAAFDAGVASTERIEKF